MANSLLTLDGMWLGLTPEEAIFLFDVMKVIGGSKADTRRVHAESILAALEKHRLEMGPLNPANDMRGSVIFSRK